MDLTVLWIILGVIGGIGVLVGIYYGLKALGVPFEKLFNGIDTAKFLINFIKLTVLEMLKDKPELADKANFIMELAEEAMDFIKEQLAQDIEVDKEQLILDAIEFADKLADSFEIVLTDGEKDVLHSTIRMAYNAWQALNK